MIQRDGSLQPTKYPLGSSTSGALLSRPFERRIWFEEQ